MRRRLLFFICLSVIIQAGDYLWPIAAKPYLSATFCEYREGHFHSGLDVKTWGEMDIPCRAITDGYIERIGAGYNGYGKVLFLKLDDGHQVVYGHLDHFIPDLEKRLRVTQAKQGKYGVDLFFTPNQMRVKRGDRLAYTGVSGTKSPHLHFEIRDTANVPINPLQFYRKIIDHKPPVVNYLAITPLSSATRINGSHLPYSYNLSNQQPGTYVLSDSIIAAGPFGLEFNGYDEANGTNNKYAIYRADLYIGDSLAFGMTYDRAPFETTGLVEFHRPLYPSYSAWRFTRLYQNQDLARLRFFLPNLNGRLNLAPGSYPLRLVLKDYAGNQSQITGLTLITQPIQTRWSTEKSGQIIFRFSRMGESDYPLATYFHTPNATSVEPRAVFYDPDAITWEFKLSADMADSGLVAILFAPEHQPEIAHLLQPKSQSIPSLRYTWANSLYGYLLQLTTQKSFVFPPAVFLTHKADSLQIPLEVLSEHLAETHRISAAARLGYDSLRIQVNQQHSVAYPLPAWRQILPGEQDSIGFNQNTLRVVLNAEPNEAPVYFKLDTMEAVIGGRRIPGFHLDQPDGSPPAQGVVKFYTGTGGPEDWKLYEQRGEKLILKSSQTESSWLTGAINGAGEYLFFIDNTPPGLVPVTVKKSFRPGDKLLFKVTDNLPPGAVPLQIQRAELNNTVIYPDYNPLRQEISYWLLPDTPKKSYQLTIVLSDQAGNQSKNQYNFRVR